MSTTVYSYAPDHAFTGMKIKLMIVVQTHQNSPNNQYHLNFDEIPFSARKICSEKNRVTLEVDLSSEYNITPGIYFLSVTCIRENMTEVSNEWAFFVLPQREQFSLPLSFGKLHCLDTNWLKNFSWAINSIDISENKITDLQFLEGYNTLIELVANNNKLGNNTKFPYLPNLRCLHLCKNEFTDLDSLIQKISVFFPSLELLSLTGNEISPWNTFHNKMYRLKIISKLHKLKQLDCKPVNNEERQEAMFHNSASFLDQNSVSAFHYNTQQQPVTTQPNGNGFAFQNSHPVKQNQFSQSFTQPFLQTPNQSNGFVNNTQHSSFNSSQLLNEFLDHNEEFEFLDWRFSPEKNYFMDNN